MDYSYDIMRMTKIRFYEWDRSELKFCCERMARLRNLVRKSGPRGFRAVLFRMVPKLQLQDLKPKSSVFRRFLLKSYCLLLQEVF